MIIFIVGPIVGYFDINRRAFEEAFAAFAGMAAVTQLDVSEAYPPPPRPAHAAVIAAGWQRR